MSVLETSYVFQSQRLNRSFQDLRSDSTNFIVTPWTKSTTRKILFYSRQNLFLHYFFWIPNWSQKKAFFLWWSKCMIRDLWFDQLLKQMILRTSFDRPFMYDWEQKKYTACVYSLSILTYGSKHIIPKVFSHLYTCLLNSKFYLIWWV